MAKDTGIDNNAAENLGTGTGFFEVRRLQPTGWN
jgi:hypothetical protein